MRADVCAVRDSLCANHPYSSARESILPLFEDELQARRTQTDVTLAEIFVHLHGMLFTRISLDDFDECLQRFLERLREETILSKRPDSTSITSFGDAEWFMIAVINLSALYQFGAEDGVLKKATDKEMETTSATSNNQHHHRKSKGPHNNGPSKVDIPQVTPQAIMLNSKRVENVTSEEELDQISKSTDAAVVKQLNGMNMNSNGEPLDDQPVVFLLAQRLAFSILDILLQQSPRLVHNSPILNPYIVMILTFLSHMAHQFPTALRHLERTIPWTRLVNLFNHIPKSIEVRVEAPAKLVGVPLPEDWCIRGMDWTGRHLFGRGHWRSKGGNHGRRDRERGDEVSANTGIIFLESEMDALSFNLNSIDESTGMSSEDNPEATVPSHQLSMGRWKRVAGTAVNLVRNVAGLDYISGESRGGRSGESKFMIVGNLEKKMKRWKKEDEDAVEAERVSRETIWLRERSEEYTGDESEDNEEESDIEDDGAESDSSAVKELKVCHFTQV
jgi:protein SMG6